jgi:hypothetical protein
MRNASCRRASLTLPANEYPDKLKRCTRRTIASLEGTDIVTLQCRIYREAKTFVTLEGLRLRLTFEGSTRSERSDTPLCVPHGVAHEAVTIDKDAESKYNVREDWKASALNLQPF